jgi:hypothetical protein
MLKKTPFSLFSLSVTKRLTLVIFLLIILWLTVAWALS